MRRAAWVLALLCVAGPLGAKPVRSAGAVVDWRSVTTPADVMRLHGWREAFVKALDETRTGGSEAEVAHEGSLLDPDAALVGAAIPVGRYRCRTIKLGSQGNGGAGFVAYPPFECRVTVEGARLRFTKIDGSQRPTGWLYPASARRQVFLGTLVLGDEIRALDYGRDPDRDMAGAIERIGAQRWRLVLPYPHFESTLDVIDLVPAS